MVELRPLIVVTGTIRIKGGETGHVRRQPGSTRRTPAKNGDKLVVVREVQISDDRRDADVIATGAARRLTRLCIMRTPFGVLCDPKDLPRIKDMITRAIQDVAKFNDEHTRAAISNCYVWERLAGNRLECVRGWLDRSILDKDEEVIAALDQLTVSKSAAA